MKTVMKEMVKMANGDTDCMGAQFYMGESDFSGKRVIEDVVEKPPTTCKNIESVTKITTHSESWMGLRGEGDRGARVREGQDIIPALGEL